jgi:hypothetical protein
MIFRPAGRFLTIPFPPRPLAARFLAAVIRPPLLFFAMCIHLLWSAGFPSAEMPFWSVSFSTLTLEISRTIPSEGNRDLRRMSPGFFVVRKRASDPPGFHKEQRDPAHERKRSDNRRNKVALSGLEVHAEEIDRLSRGCESDARVTEHEDAECDQKSRDDGFCVHGKSPVYFVRLASS